MEDHNQNPTPSPASSSSMGSTCRRHRRHVMEEEEECVDAVACTGKSCQSCTAGVIADCVAVCCCPCAVVNILTLAFFKLPYAVARKCITRRKMKNRRRILEERKKCGGVVIGDRNVISEKRRGEIGNSSSEIVVSRSSISGIGEMSSMELNDDFSAEDIWLELYEVGHLGFGRVSFTGFPFHNKGN